MPHLHIVRDLAKSFVNSKLTPVIIFISIFLGILSIVFLPREEEPQINVPMADVFVEMAGASPQEVTNRVIYPMEKLIQDVPGVEYIYSKAMPGKAMMTVRFYVGQNLEDSLVKLYNKLYSNFDKIPPGVSKPLIKPKSIDDVPILTLTLWGNNYDGYTLRQIASQLCETIKQTPDISETTIIGGYRKFLKINLIPSKMSAYNVDPYEIIKIIQSVNNSSYPGNITFKNKEIQLKFQGFLNSKDELDKIVLKTFDNKPIYLNDVANIELAPEEVNNYVMFKDKHSLQSPAVTISIAKRKGTNATIVANNIINKIKTIRSSLVPSDINITITKNYGDTAAERSNELLVHMFIAIFSVTVLIWLVLGKRESLVVALAIPTTLALTLSTFALYGFTLNRVTFFALIFSVGILVDDAIVVVENIVRHLKNPLNKDENISNIVIEATDEVGNPTILATMTVIAAILPMAFVGGLMGPYMRPIPIGSSTAMVFSMLIAFIVIPWASVRILGHGYLRNQENKEKTEDYLTSMYRKTMNRLIFIPKQRKIFILGIVILLICSCSLVLFKLVKVKMLPFDNKSEFQVIIDTKEGTTLENTMQVAQEIADYLITIKDVVNYQIYCGVASPFNFNGLIRHYYLRNAPYNADIQVNLQHKEERTKQSHDVVKQVRPQIAKIAQKYGANVKISEVPPGPPVLQTLVAEVYGPDYKRQKEIAQELINIFKKSPNVVDVDWYMEDPHEELTILIDHEKTLRTGLNSDKVSDSVEIAFKGKEAGLLHDEISKEDVPIWLQIPSNLRAGLLDIIPLRLINNKGDVIPIESLVKFVINYSPTSIYHKNLMPVVYVTADVSGNEESPVYSIMNLYKEINKLELPEGYKLGQYFTSQPSTNNKYSIKWDGEWQITYEVFKDLGIAFLIVLVLIYGLIVGWFQSFKTPLIIMSVIPFSLIGIMPAHMLMGAFFTATSMIGFIAGAGIVVRNSIILVDFIELRLKEGLTLSEAVIEAGAVRFKPMMLTAAAVVVGSSVILFDPIFQGLAISLMAGELASLFISRTTVPILYYVVNIKSYLNSKIIVNKENANLLDTQSQITGC